MFLPTNAINRSRTSNGPCIIIILSGVLVPIPTFLTMTFTAPVSTHRNRVMWLVVCFQSAMNSRTDDYDRMLDTTFAPTTKDTASML